MTAWKLLEAEAMRWVGDPRAQVVWTSAMLRVMMGASGMPLDLSMLQEDKESEREREERDCGRRKT